MGWRRPLAWVRPIAAGLTALAAAAGACHAAPCPGDGASVEVVLEPAEGGEPVTALVFGTVTTSSCEDVEERLAAGYADTLTCHADVPASCRVTVGGLRPGNWAHRIQVREGEAAGQLQGRAHLLLDRIAGTHVLAWPLYRSVHSVTTLDDALGCRSCLRAAISAANDQHKPALVQFAPDLTGSIVLAVGPLQALSSGQVTVDGFDTAGVPLTRTIDGNGIDAAALKITSAGNQVFGLRFVNVGGDSDTVLVEGVEANDNLLDSLQVIGRAVEPCGTNNLGCVLDGICVETTPQAPQGVCGDDGIAVRNLAGAAIPNRVRRSIVSGARDKGIKVSDGGVAVVERSLLIGNAEGGLQATLGGTLSARENVSRDNRGTTTASGLAVNGADVGSLDPGRLDTRGNLSIGNALRGISVRSLSVATLRDDFVCGNGTAGSGNGVGVSLLAAAGFSPSASAAGLAVVHNADGGVVVNNDSQATFAPDGMPGENAFAFNGPPLPTTPVNLRNLSTGSVTADGNAWEHCGPGRTCDAAAVLARDVFAVLAPVAVAPALPTRRHAAPTIRAIAPTYAAGGELVRIYGSGFDAIDGAGASCASVAAANTCRPLRGNCVFIGRTPAEVVAVTPTMLVVRAPFTCVEPMSLRIRTRWGRGTAAAAFCVVPPAPES